MKSFNKREYNKKYNKKYREVNKVAIWKKDKERTKKYRQLRRKTDPIFRMTASVRSRVHSALKRKTKLDKTFDLIGCSVLELKKYLETRFKQGMSWENYGFRGWHIDHIKPCCQFDLARLEEQQKCFHYTNLQPLWASDNIRKARKPL